MKALILTAVILLFAQYSLAATVEVSLDDVTKRVSNENFTVHTKARRVYQARESIAEARGRLLPSLTIWKVVKVAVGILDPMSWIDNITDMAPFLVPANWFRVEERALLYKADRQGYKALWANELHTARSLYMRILLDQELLKVVQQTRKDFEDVFTVVQERVALGSEKPEVAREIEFQIIGLKEDERQLGLLIRSSLDALSLSLGFPAKTKLVLKSVVMPDLKTLRMLKYDDLDEKVIENSPEVAQMSQFLRVIPLIEKEYSYSFFGGSSITRGVAGGVFDHLPSSDGLSLANAPGQRIVKTEEKILRNQRKAISETILRQLKGAVDSYNSAVDFYPKHETRVGLANENIEQVKIRIILGEKLDLLNFLQFVHSRNVALTSIVQARFSVVLSRDKVNRLSMTNAYAKGPTRIR